MCSSSPAQSVFVCPVGTVSVPYTLLVHSLHSQGHPFLHSRTLSLREREEKEKEEGREKGRILK